MQFQNAPLASNITLAPQTKETPHRVFWFKKLNGEVFCSREEEAWNILCGRVKVFENGRQTDKRHEYLGASDSMKYFSGLKEMEKVFNEQGHQKAQEFLRELEKREFESADKSIRPRNFDRMNSDGLPVDAEGNILKR